MHGMDNLKIIVTGCLNFHEIWHGCLVINGHANLILFPAVVNNIVAGAWAWKVGMTLVGHMFKVAF